MIVTGGLWGVAHCYEREKYEGDEIVGSQFSDFPPSLGTSCVRLGQNYAKRKQQQTSKLPPHFFLSTGKVEVHVFGSALTCAVCFAEAYAWPEPKGGFLEISLSRGF